MICILISLILNFNKIFFLLIFFFTYNVRIKSKRCIFLWFLPVLLLSLWFCLVMVRIIWITIQSQMLDFIWLSFISLLLNTLTTRFAKFFNFVNLIKLYLLTILTMYEENVSISFSFMHITAETLFHLFKVKRLLALHFLYRAILKILFYSFRLILLLITWYHFHFNSKII